MKTTFHDLPIETAPGRVFTPRATTEALVDAALEQIDGVPLRIADVGTGSGAIAVALAVKKPHVEIWATDTSEEAVRLARANAERLGVADRVHVLQGDMLDPLSTPVDLIVANLPYLAPGTDGYAAEPSAAVFSTGDGLDHYRRLLAGAADHLADDGGILIQFDGEVLEAERSELPWLRSRLESLVLAA